MAQDSTPKVNAAVSDATPTTFPGYETLTGRYVRLERLTDAHVPGLFAAVASQPSVWTYIADGPFSSAEEFSRELVEFNAKNVVAIYTVLQGEEASGIITFGPADLASRVGELGAQWSPHFQRTRGGTEAIYLILKHVFGQRYRRVEWKCDSFNTASRRAAERYGLTYEGTLRQHQIMKGRNRDSCWYSILDREWDTCRRGYEMWLDEANFDEQGKQKRRLEDLRQSLAHE